MLYRKICILSDFDCIHQFVSFFAFVVHQKMPSLLIFLPMNNFCLFSLLNSYQKFVFNKKMIIKQKLLFLRLNWSWRSESNRQCVLPRQITGLLHYHSAHASTKHLQVRCSTIELPRHTKQLFLLSKKVWLITFRRAIDEDHPKPRQS